MGRKVGGVECGSHGSALRFDRTSSVRFTPILYNGSSGSRGAPVLNATLEPDSYHGSRMHTYLRAFFLT